MLSDVPVLTLEANNVLRSMVRAYEPRRDRRGASNAWTAGRPNAAVDELVLKGLARFDGYIRPETAVYRATEEGMRVAGLSPREIERCVEVTRGLPSFLPTTEKEIEMDTTAPRLQGEALEAATAATTAPKNTKESIKARISDVSYSWHQGTTTLCQITLDNGWTSFGFSACVSPENFDIEIGKGYAYDDAFDKLWPLFGFLLAEDLYRAKPARVGLTTKDGVWVPPEALEDARTFKPFPGELLDFGQALAALKDGKAVARKGWNGHNMWLYRVPPATYQTQTEVAKFAFGDSVAYRAYYAMVTVDRDVVPWVALQTDIEATDWVLVDREQTKAA